MVGAGSVLFVLRALAYLRIFVGVDHAVTVVEVIETPVLDDLVVGLPAGHLVRHHAPDGPLEVIGQP